MILTREILFRGKDINTGKWVYGGLDTDWGLPPDQRERFWIIVPYYDAVFVDPSTIGQFTGRVASSSKVFEGDICKSIDGTFLVVWDDEKAAFMIQFACDGVRMYLEEMWDDSEIIGNIYDNPDILGIYE